MTLAAFDAHRLSYTVAIHIHRTSHTSHTRPRARLFAFSKSQNPKIPKSQNPKIHIPIHAEPAFFWGIFFSCIPSYCLPIDKTQERIVHPSPVRHAMGRRASRVGRRASTLSHTRPCFTARRRVRASSRQSITRADARADVRAEFDIG